MKLHTIPEAAKCLGCSENHVYRLIAAGELSVVNIAPTSSTRTKLRVEDADLAGYIKDRTRRVSASSSCKASLAHWACTRREHGVEHRSGPVLWEENRA